MAKFREILRLHEMGYSQCAIAQSCAVARSTVQDYIRRATAKNLSYKQLRQLSDNEVKELLGKGKRTVSQRTELVDFAVVDFTTVVDPQKLRLDSADLSYIETVCLKIKQD